MAIYLLEKNNNETMFICLFKYYSVMYKNHFSGDSAPMLLSRMRDKTITMVGDSTLRQWYVNMMQRLHCKSVTEQWSVQKWRRPSVCRNEEYNLTIGWYPHCQPFTTGMGKYEDNSYTHHCASRRLLEISDDEDVIFVFNVFNHISIYHHETFKNKVLGIKNNLVELLKRNPKVQFLIKGPHTYQQLDKLRKGDFYVYEFTNILFEVFEDLHDKVVFMNNVDTSDALKLSEVHPPEFVVSAMVDQMFSYVCL